MRLVNRRVVQVDHNLRNQKGMHHHLLVHLRTETEVSNVQNSQNFKARPSQSQGIVEQGGSGISACGRTHPSRCRDGPKSCFKCSKEGHFMRKCPKNKQGGGNLGNRDQS